MDRLSPDLHGERVDPGDAAESEDGSAAMAMAIAMASHRRNILATLVSLSLACARVDKPYFYGVIEL